MNDTERAASESLSVHNEAVDAQRQLAIDHLTMLGLAFRLEAVVVPNATWPELARLASNVKGCISYSAPEQVGRSVIIDEMRNAPDAGGWIVGGNRVNPPYWIDKTDLGKLRALEELLDKLAC